PPDGRPARPARRTPRRSRQDRRTCSGSPRMCVRSCSGTRRSASRRWRVVGGVAGHRTRASAERSVYAAAMAELTKREEIVALCKRRGFIFPASEIYGGFANTYDYGHYGVLLKNNVKNEWWRAMLQERDDIVALDSAIIQNPKAWEASGHL